MEFDMANSSGVTTIKNEFIYSEPLFISREPSLYRCWCWCVMAGWMTWLSPLLFAALLFSSPSTLSHSLARWLFSFLCARIWLKRQNKIKLVGAKEVLPPACWLCCCCCWIGPASGSVLEKGVRLRVGVVGKLGVVGGRIYAWHSLPPHTHTLAKIHQH